MRLVIRFIELLTNSQIFISLAAMSLFLAGFMILSKSNDFIPFPEAIIVAISSWLIYFLYRSNAKSIGFPPFLLMVAVVLFSSIMFLDWKQILYLLHLAIISLFYQPSAWLNTLKKPSLRKIPQLKIIILAYVWASMSSFFPAMILDTPVLNADSIILFIAHFLFIMAIMIPFEIRDIDIDRKHLINTIPQKIGLKTSKLIAIILLILFGLLINQLSHSFWLIWIVVLVALPLVWRSSPFKSSLYFFFWVDGLIILYFLLVWFSFFIKKGPAPFSIFY